MGSGIRAGAYAEAGWMWSATQYKRYFQLLGEVDKIYEYDRRSLFAVEAGLCFEKIFPVISLHASLGYHFTARMTFQREDPEFIPGGAVTLSSQWSGIRASIGISVGGILHRTKE